MYNTVIICFMQLSTQCINSVRIILEGCKTRYVSVKNIQFLSWGRPCLRIQLDDDRTENTNRYKNSRPEVFLLKQAEAQHIRNVHALILRKMSTMLYRFFDDSPRLNSLKLAQRNRAIYAQTSRRRNANNNLHNSNLRGRRSRLCTIRHPISSMAFIVMRGNCSL